MEMQKKKSLQQLKPFLKNKNKVGGVSSLDFTAHVSRSYRGCAVLLGRQTPGSMEHDRVLRKTAPKIIFYRGEKVIK